METQSALGSALQAGFKLLSPTGGRMTVFQTQLPNLGAGALQSREDPNQRASAKVRAQMCSGYNMYRTVQALYLQIQLHYFSASWAVLFFFPLRTFNTSPPQQTSTRRWLWTALVSRWQLTCSCWVHSTATWPRWVSPTSKMSTKVPSHPGQANSGCAGHVNGSWRVQVPRTPKWSARTDEATRMRGGTSARNSNGPFAMNQLPEISNK